MGRPTAPGGLGARSNAACDPDVGSRFDEEVIPEGIASEDHSDDRTNYPPSGSSGENTIG